MTTQKIPALSDLPAALAGLPSAPEVAGVAATPSRNAAKKISWFEPSPLVEKVAAALKEANLEVEAFHSHHAEK